MLRVNLIHNLAMREDYTLYFRRSMPRDDFLGKWASIGTKTQWWLDYGNGSREPFLYTVCGKVHRFL